MTSEPAAFSTGAVISVGPHGRVEFQFVPQAWGECEVEQVKVVCVRPWMELTGLQGRQN